MSVFQGFCFQHKSDISVQNDIEGFNKTKMYLVGFELTTATTTGLEF